MKVLIVIPARMASVRFPNKPMALLNNKPMILHVWERAKESKIGRVLVACCEKEVADCIRSAGGEAILTNPNLASGTDRVYAAIENNEELDLSLKSTGTLRFYSTISMVMCGGLVAATVLDYQIQQ